MNDQHAPVDWRDGTVPVSRRFDDMYYSLAGGLDETRHVFLAGNDLPARFAPAFHIAETGFGTGLNFLVTWAAWRAAGAPAPLHFTTFEAFPMAPADMARALAAFPALVGPADALVAALAAGTGPYDFGGLTLTIVPGDVRETLPGWAGRADAWYLDGFSPAKNPEMWGEGLMAEVARHTAPGGTAATYTAAGHVRRALAAAGFDVARAPGYGRKRHMTRARLPA
ncbi:MAG: tRNA (5-methylaminomethyl-2-thiouridine)(34)-methyltransferase MnmD [Limimaricola sp.]|uniref:tRNA (5-methylaminomethyl-2-thiouridine)(34)-methyltransferase MnmD n=1 Tax=Limimaricola sp. TaxID=2211665 RepID=UPI001DEC11E8|nr:tRNA (5-methylaminomethyl-2-thiouridine)(34)-methyltransferase MnmD [Limimaricola sp.]MBI1418700.1 tRNA (5-methylaminomethyl-2-thiouridine)(34)-methyltransferase MnmD [Limimaricola sp.]